MNRLNGALFGVGLLLLGSLPTARAAPPCEPGYQWIEETCYKQVERHVCKVVPEVKKVKKIVYTTKEEPFCLRRSGLAALKHHEAKEGCDTCEGTCPKCKGPYPHTILVKTEITCDEVTTKCVTEKVVETVPYIVRRKVPCAPVCAPVCAEPQP